MSGIWTFPLTDFQQRLESELLNRTQGEDEEVRTYMFKLSAIAKKFQPAISERRKLDVLYKNLKPQMKEKLYSVRYSTVKEFIARAIEAEDSVKAATLVYRPPPSKDQSLLPDSAYTPSPNRQKKSNVNACAVETSPVDVNALAVQVAAIMQESALCVREIRTGSDARVRKKS